MNDWFSSLQANFGIKKLKGIEIQTILFFHHPCQVEHLFFEFFYNFIWYSTLQLEMFIGNATLKVSTLNQMPYLFG